MTQQRVDLGTPPDGIDGDTVPIAFAKHDANFDQLYAAVAAGGGGGGAPFDPSAIEAEIVSLRTDLGAESSTRASTDTDLRSYIDAQIAQVNGGAGAGVSQTDFNSEVTLRTAGDSDLRSYIDQQISDVSISGGASFKAVGAGSVTRTLAAKLSDYPVNVLDFYNSTTDGGDYGPAFKRAFAAGYRRVDIPGKTITVNNPILPVENMHIQGVNKPVSTSLSVIVAPNGFILSPGTGADSRIHFTLRDFSITAGNSTATLLEGPMSGTFDAVQFRSCRRGVDSNSAFLWRFTNCRFEGSITEFGITVADFNGCRIQDCYFNRGVVCHLSMIDTPPGVKDYQPGFPVILSGNNHNMGGPVGANRSALKLRGTVAVRDCYFEDEASVQTGNIFIEFIANTFDPGSFEVRNCEINGLGHALHCILIRGQGSPAYANGIITSNRMGGVKGADIHFGDRGASTNAHVEGLRILDNLSSARLPPVIENGSPYRPVAHSQAILSPTLSIAGGTFIRVPIGTGIDVDNRGNFGPTTYNISKSGFWSIRCYLTCTANGTTSYPDISGGIFVNGTQVEFADGSLTSAGAGNRIADTLSTELFKQLVKGDVVTLQAKNGQSIAQFSFTAQWVGDGWS